LKRASLILTILAVFALGLAGCAGPSQAQYNEALENLGAANLRNQNLQDQVDFLEETVGQLQLDLFTSEKQLSEAVIAREQMEEQFASLQVAGLCSQTWELVTDPELVVANMTEAFLTPDMIEMGYVVFATQYLTLAEPQFLEDLPVFFMLGNLELFPGVVIDLTQGCLIVQPQTS